MGARGPAKAPAVLRLLNGRTPGHDSGGRPVEIPPPFERSTGAPQPPDYLSPYAREVWDLSSAQLIKLNLTKPEDFAALASYCEAVEQFRVTTLDIQQRGMTLTRVVKGVRWVAFGSDEWDREACEVPGHGYFVPQPNEEVRINPSVAARASAMGQIRQFAMQFGLTPAAESNLAGLIESRSGRGGSGDDAGNPFAATG